MQIDGVAMGSPLSPVIANFFIEAFQHSALEGEPLQPICFYMKVETFVVWPHDRKMLNDFLTYNLLWRWKLLIGSLLWLYMYTRSGWYPGTLGLLETHTHCPIFEWG